ncbi:MAG: hypothetical protein L6R40_001059 [Gallowayella cf. fulva]|nr:MAG: hypothetical protein L6R40_001059 [Xanthomendoza cf. fulva]
MSSKHEIQWNTISFSLLTVLYPFPQSLLSHFPTIRNDKFIVTLESFVYNADFRTKEKRTYAAAFDVVGAWIRNESLEGFKSPYVRRPDVLKDLKRTIDPDLPTATSASSSSSSSDPDHQAMMPERGTELGEDQHQSEDELGNVTVKAGGVPAEVQAANALAAIQARTSPPPNLLGNGFCNAIENLDIILLTDPSGRTVKARKTPQMISYAASWIGTSLIQEPDTSSWRMTVGRTSVRSMGDTSTQRGKEKPAHGKAGGINPITLTSLAQSRPNHSHAIQLGIALVQR